MMNKNEFRLASSVELYDAGVIIKPDIDQRAGFFDYSMLGFSISGYTLDKLAQIFMIDTTSAKLGRDHRVYLSNMTLPIKRETVVYGSNFSEDGKLKYVYARVEGPHLLSLRLIEEWQEGQEVKEYRHEHVYSGSFGIEWAQEGEKKKEAE